MDYLKKIEELISPKLKPGTQVTEKSTMRDLGIDSFDLVDIVTTLEDDLNITFEDEELYNVKTIENVITLLNQKVNN